MNAIKSKRVNALICFGLLFLISVYFVNYFGHIQTYKLDIGGQELAHIYFVHQILEKGKLYLKPDVYPYATATYTPLYYHMVASICKIVEKFHQIDVRTICMTGRYFNLIINIFPCVALFHLCKN